MGQDLYVCLHQIECVKPKDGVLFKCRCVVVLSLNASHSLSCPLPQNPHRS